MTVDEIVTELAAVIDGVDGLRLAVSRGFGPGTTAQRSRQAIQLRPGAVRVRVVARRLPLPPLLDEARLSVRRALTGTPWQDAVITLAVSDLDAVAFE